MEKRTLLILGVIILMVVIAVTIYLIPKGENCTSIVKNTNLRYDSCYDQKSKQILITVFRGYDPYVLKSMALKTLEQSANLELPLARGKTTGKIPMNINPAIIEIQSEIVSGSKTCQKSDTININTCTENQLSLNLDILLNSSSSVQDNSYEISSSSSIIPPNFISKNLFNPSCRSDWLCGPWEQCLNNIQRRDCTDGKSCLIPTEVPDFQQSCSSKCKENWQCSWTDCIDGQATPDCIDLNKCGTEFTKPTTLPCLKLSTTSCAPDIECGEFSGCNIDYGITNLNNIENIQGVRTRLCKDNTGCLMPVYESETCSIKSNVYTKQVEIGNRTYLEIYDKTTNSMIARVQYTGGDTPSLNLNFFAS